MSTFTKGLLAAFLLSALVPACGKKPVESNTNESTIAEDRPADSTGTLTDVTLSLGVIAPALHLAAPVLDLGNGVKISEAKFVLDTIKIKAQKDESKEEQELSDLLKQEKAKQKETIKSQEETWEKSYEEEKKAYEVQKEEANSDSEKAAAEAAWETRKAALEAEKATLQAKVESALDALEQEHDANIRWKGPYVYDAVTGTLDKDLPTIQIVDGSYERIEFKLKPYRNGAAGDPLLNQSIMIKGTVLVGANEVPFIFSTEKDEELKLKGAGAMKIDAGLTNTMQIAFNVQAGFANADLASLNVDSATGSILIDELHNKDLMETIVKAIKKGVHFGKDSDGDGKLGDDEKAGDGEEGVAEEEVESQE